MDPDAPSHAQLVDLDSLDTPESDHVTLTAKEQLVLRLWDQLRELELERALLKAGSKETPPSPTDTSPDALLTAERAALDSRATYLLRNRITDQVLITDPILKAVHATNSASNTAPNLFAPFNYRLLPLIHTRDVLSLSHAQLTTDLSARTTTLANVGTAVTAANARNKVLAATLLELAARKSKKNRGADSVREYLEALEGPSTGGGEALDDEAMQGVESASVIPNALKAELEAAEREMREAQRRWRVMKGVAAGVVVGSGVDWAEDEGLRGLVMGADDDDELGFEGDDEVMKE
ncbi:uncharacterized protein J3D65DRAFT_632677 [Phyllosticta citribraziliensis]|uniref:Centromere protein H C-terminal domain-containing protein n=1 Tax=Phyllosticta citribraziliensis TaxID=989973 RepID=A0ABR1LHM1_9PEZI